MCRHLVRADVCAWVGGGGGAGESAALTLKVRQSITGLPTVVPSSAGVKGRDEGRSKGIAPAGKSRTKDSRKHLPEAAEGSDGSTVKALHHSKWVPNGVELLPATRAREGSGAPHSLAAHTGPQVPLPERI